MKVYLVGGAVRDRLLGRPVEERDYVVVGATPDEMLQRGFKKVGRDFPVFLHPVTHAEYALARTERKVGRGYTNFVCYADPSVTLEEDLLRRDLTINAMAEDENGEIIDPYGGQQDLERQLLKHVSPAFAEDPVRILRVARFAARLGGFTIAPETNHLMEEMVINHEVDALVPERVWQELERALRELHPERFFQVLQACGALERLLPAVAANWSTIQDALRRAVNLSPTSTVRWAAICCSWSSSELRNWHRQYRLPRAYQNLARITQALREPFATWQAPTAAEVIALLERLDGYRRPERLNQALTAAQANYLHTDELASRIWEAYQVTQSVRPPTELITSSVNRGAISPALHQLRVEQLANHPNWKAIG